MELFEGKPMGTPEFLSCNFLNHFTTGRRLVPKSRLCGMSNVHLYKSAEIRKDRCVLMSWFSPRSWVRGRSPGQVGCGRTGRPGRQHPRLCTALPPLPWPPLAAPPLRPPASPPASAPPSWPAQPMWCAACRHGRIIRHRSILRNAAAMDLCVPIGTGIQCYSQGSEFYSSRKITVDALNILFGTLAS